MLTTTKNWKLTSYTNSTWTNVVNEVATLAAVVIANTDLVNPITVGLRLSGGAVILPSTSIPAGATYSLDLRSLNVITGESLQMEASAAGINVIASGAI